MHVERFVMRRIEMKMVFFQSSGLVAPPFDLVIFEYHIPLNCLSFFNAENVGYTG